MRSVLRRILYCVPGVRMLRRWQRLSWALEQSYRNQGLLAARCVGVPKIDPALSDVDDILGTRSSLCRERDFHHASYHRWCTAFGETPRYHRKQWEFVAIAAAFANVGIYKSGARVLGFGVGTEPLPAMFAAHGMSVVATDQAEENAKAQGWVDTQQHAGGLRALNRPQLISDSQLAAQVTYQALDMNSLPHDLGTFDGIWSACAIEHLGSIEQTLSFISNAMRFVRPGGVAVHTTEFNVSSNDDTIASGPTVLLRQRDIEILAQRLSKEGHELATIDLTRGDDFLDNYVDVPPYNLNAHLRLLIERYSSTSIVLIIRKKS